MEPSNGPLDKPTELTQATAMFSLAPAEQGRDSRSQRSNTRSGSLS
jgi:hypothetical protein